MNESGYMYEDGRPDDIKTLQTNGRCMARSLSFLLKEKEGIIVELRKQDDYPDDDYGMYIIWKSDGCIRGQEYDGEEFDGTMMWFD